MCAFKCIAVSFKKNKIYIKNEKKIFEYFLYNQKSIFLEIKKLQYNQKSLKIKKLQMCALKKKYIYKNWKKDILKLEIYFFNHFTDS